MVWGYQQHAISSYNIDLDHCHLVRIEIIHLCAQLLYRNINTRYVFTFYIIHNFALFRLVEK